MSLSPVNTDDMTDEQIQQLMELGVIPEQQNGLQQQMDIAKKLRYDNMPQMRGEGGRVQTAANPLEFLASGIQGYKAGKDMDELRKKQDGLLQQQVQGRKLFYQALRGNRGQPQQPQGLGPKPPLEESF
jgi:hypothetical protein